ncbi:MAG: energy-coupling factor transporter transmembrane protein EcfT [Anaerolineae bacterium]|nr:energy-coupling factor transporter transmembrane protein EcfT [Anaerolineae bacterium]
MDSRFDLYVAHRGWAHGIDPRIKLLFVLAGIVSLTLFSNLFFLLAALLSIHLLMASAGVPRERFLWVWKTMVPINLLLPVLWALFYPEGGALFELGILRLTPLAVIRGLGIAARLDTMAFICFFWLFTTDQRAIVHSLVRVGLPFEWGLVLAISLRHLSTFHNLYQMITEAQQARALDLSKKGFLQRLKAQLPILVAMVINSLRIADKLALALESRAFGLEGVRRTYLHDIRCTRRDYLLGGLILLGFCGLIWVRTLGLFTHPLYPG